MKRRIATGIDIGTAQVKVVVVEEIRAPGGIVPRILGTGMAEAKGLRHGYVINKEEVAAAIEDAKAQAEHAARMPIKAGFLSVGGISLDEIRVSAEAVISRADQEVSDADIEKLGEVARERAGGSLLNRRILHEIPLSYRLDGEKMFGAPLGMKGVRLESDFLFVTALAQHVDALTEAVEDANIEVIDSMASPLAGSNVTLNRDQKTKGCVLVNVGAETTSIIVYDEGIPISVKVFPMGSSDLTSDIALGFRVSLEDAERLKLGRLSGAMYSKRKVDDLIASRFSRIFDLVDKHLRLLGRRGMLPAGIVLSGGGSAHATMLEVAKHSLALPARMAELKPTVDGKVKDSAWAVAYGVALWGLTGDTEAPKRSALSQAGKSLERFFRQFMP